VKSARAWFTSQVRSVIALMAAVAAALVCAAPAAAAGPFAFTGGATDATLHGATLTATINPHGAASTYHFEYGLTSAYGARTPDVSAGSGTGDMLVSAPVADLAHSTIYHFRVVATSDAGTAAGYDQTFRTREPPQVPNVSTMGAGDATPTSVTLSGSLDPHDAPTTYHFEYGLTSAYGMRTPDVALNGYGPRVVSQTITRLAVNTEYHYRLVASNPTGTTYGGDRRVATQRWPTAIAFRVATSDPVIWAAAVQLTGRVQGKGIGGIALAVERDEFPYDGRFTELKRFTAGDDGAFRTSVGPLWRSVRLRVVTRAPPRVDSPSLEVLNRLRVGIIRDGGTRPTLGLRGSISPAADGARVVVQSQSRSGRWRSLVSSTARSLRGNRSRYSVRVRRPMRSTAMRVVVLPKNDGAHVRGFSRALKIGGQL
jgi:hypothetical protein